MNLEKLRTNIKATPELMKKINKTNYYEVEKFILDALEYIKAIKEGRMLCIIKSVSASGMSRVMRFHSCKRIGTYYVYRSHDMVFEMFGYKQDKSGRGFRIDGCGMDMIFHTNYTIIHRLTSLGFLTKEECDKLAQESPTQL